MYRHEQRRRRRAAGMSSKLERRTRKKMNPIRVALRNGCRVACESVRVTHPSVCTRLQRRGACTQTPSLTVVTFSLHSYKLGWRCAGFRSLPACHTFPFGSPRLCACVRAAVAVVAGETGFCSVFLPLMALSTRQAESAVSARTNGARKRISFAPPTLHCVNQGYRVTVPPRGGIAEADTAGSPLCTFTPKQPQTLRVLRPLQRRQSHSRPISCLLPLCRCRGVHPPVSPPHTRKEPTLHTWRRTCTRRKKVSSQRFGGSHTGMQASTSSVL